MLISRRVTETSTSRDGAVTRAASARGPALVRWLELIARAQPQRPAVLEGDAVWSYGELWERAGRVAAGLLERGAAAPHARVGLVGRNSAEYLAAYLGILRAGAVAVPLNFLLKPHELLAHLALAQAECCLLGDVDEEVASAIGAALDAPAIADVYAPSDRPLPAIGPETEAALLPTSGSTGAPKGVLLTHGTIAHSALELAIAFPCARDEVTICFLPMFAAMNEQVFPMLVSGGAVDILRRFDPEEISRRCDRATSFAAVPTLMAQLLEHGDLRRLRRLRWVMFASEPMPPALLDRWWEALPAVETHEFYGMTEALTITYASHELLREDNTCVGRPFPTSAVDIVDGNGAPAALGEAGEVVCATPARMLHYFGNPEATEAALTRDGAMRTGDLGAFDEAGRLHLTGRLKDIIVSGGFNISPAEIEAAACRHPDVAAAAVVGIPHARFGETPVVVAVPKRGRPLHARELLGWCRADLSSFKRPTAAAVVERLPATGIGKSSKGALREAILNNEVELEHAH